MTHRTTHKITGLGLVLLTLLSGCSLARQKTDEKVGTVAVNAIEEKNPVLAQEIREEAAANISAGLEWPWLMALKSNWIAVLLTFLSGGLVKQLVKLRKKAGLVGSIAEVLSQALSKPVGDPATAISAAAKAHPNLPSGSIRDLMAKAGIRPSR